MPHQNGLYLNAANFLVQFRYIHVYVGPCRIKAVLELWWKKITLLGKSNISHYKQLEVLIIIFFILSSYLNNLNHFWEFIDTRYQWKFINLYLWYSSNHNGSDITMYYTFEDLRELDLFPYLMSDLLFFVILSLILGYTDHENKHYSGVTVRQTEWTLSTEFLHLWWETNILYNYVICLGFK